MPAVGKLYIANLTSDSFSILWNGTHGEFDGFVLEIIDSNWLMETKEYNLSHLVRCYDITGLRPSTDYVAYLYGTLKGSRTNAVSIVASTGISFFVSSAMLAMLSCHTCIDPMFPSP